MNAGCPLCEKLQDPPADELVWRFPHSVALLGPWQYYTGYCVLVSRIHATELHHLPADIRPAFLEEMVLLAQAIEIRFQPRKMNYELLGNQVSHLHWHLFPRRAEDPDTRNAVWLALDRAERDAQEKQRLQTPPLPRAEIVAQLVATLKQLHAPTL